MDPALYKAATLGNVSTLRKLVAFDVKILNSKTPQGHTALHLAALHGHARFAGEVLSVSEELLFTGNVDWDTPVHLAAKMGKLKVLELLVGLARDTLLMHPLEMRNRAGNTPLHEAVANRRSAVALALIDANLRMITVVNERHESPLEIASREGLVDVVRKIVDIPWVDAEFVEPFGGTALHQVVLGGHPRIMEILLEKRSDLISLTDSSGNNALHYAVQKNDARAVDMLLDRKVSLAYERNHVQQTPLHVAARYGSPEGIKALLRRCPDVAEMVDDKGRNAFHAAVVSGKLDALRCLLSRVRAAELLNQVDRDGNTPLHLSASMLHVPCALMLLEDRRVDPCILNGDGQTARSLVQANAAGGENAMDAYEMYLWKQLKRQESKRCRKHQLPPVTLPRHKGSGKEAIKQSVGIHLVIATLVATVTFAATITMPGGYSQIDGTAMHAHRGAFKIFVISDTVAMCSSIIVLLCFLWAWQDPSRFRMSLFVLGHRLNIVSCLAMLSSLMAAVYVTVAPIVPWLAYFVIAIGAATPVFVFLVAGRQIFYPVEV